MDVPVEIPKGKMLAWANGAWTLGNDLLADRGNEPVGEDDWDEYLAEKGWQETQVFGNESGIHFTLYYGPNQCWLVDFSTASECFYIRADGLANMLDLTTKLAPLTTASVLARPEVADLIFEQVDKRRKEQKQQQRKVGAFSLSR